MKQTDLRAFAAAFAALPFLSAVIASSLSAQAETEPDAYELPAFEVTAGSDQGYLASNVLSAYRINATIKEIPFNIQVVTDEFLKDHNAVSLIDAVQYVAGVTVGNTSMQEQDIFNIRGLRASRPKRNGYRRYYSFDMTNVQRVEVVKGPSSALFGEAQPGGIINYITKRPLPERETEVSVRYGRWDNRRFYVGHTGPFREDDKRLLYRIDASYQKSNGYRDFEREERAVVAPVISWEPTDRTKVIVDFEWFYQNFNPPSGNLIWNESATRAYWERWVGFAPDDWADLPALTAEFYERLEADPALGLQFRFMTQPSSFPQEDGSPRYTDIYPTYLAPLTYSTTGPDTYTKFDVRTITGEVQHRFTDWASVRAVASTGKTETEFVRANTQRVRVWGDGFQQGKRYAERTNEVISAQLDGMFSFHTGPVRHRVIVGAEYMADNFELFQVRNRVPGGAEPSQIMFLFPETYQLFLGYDLSFPGEDNLVLGPIRISEDDFFDADGNPILLEIDSYSTRDLYSLYISDQLNFFDGRVRVLLGLRYDRVYQTIERTLNTPDPFDTPTLSQTTPQFGINWYVTPDIVLYGNYSESFTPVEGMLRNEDGSTSPKPPERGEGGEVGIKGTFLDGAVSATVAVFDITKTDVVRPGLRDDGSRFDILADGQKSRGFEIDLMARPLPGLQLIFGYAYIDSEEILAGEDPTADFDRRIVGVPQNQVTLWSKYTFQETALKGLELGGGFTYLGERRGAQTNRDIIFLDSYTKFDALVAYRFSRNNVDYRLALRVDNVFDTLYFRPGVFVGNPRNATISLTVNF